MIALCAFFEPQGPTKSQGSALLRLPLSSDPLVRGKIPLTTALSEVGVQVRNGFVLFGIEVLLKDGKEPTVNLDLPSNSTLGNALEQIFRQLPDYSFQTVGHHLINIWPKGAGADPKNILNLRVERFEVVNEPPSSVLSMPQRFIPELYRVLTDTQVGRPSGTAGSIKRPVGGPRVTLHLRNVTVRQILNSVSEASEQSPVEFMPLGWVCSVQPDSTARGGVRSVWRIHWSVPSNWKQWQ
jgi:hypothetical protein